MIDYEVKIFNRAHSKAAHLCAKNKFLSTQIVSVTDMPAAGLFEMNNSTVRERQGTALEEKFARITYQLDVYAASKSECRNVFAAVDDAMIGMNFTRISGRYIDNPGRPDIFRYTARYEAEIDRDGNLYRRR